MTREDDIMRHLKLERVAYAVKMLLGIVGACVALAILLWATFVPYVGNDIKVMLIIIAIVASCFLIAFTLFIVRVHRRHNRPVDDHIEDAMVQIRAKEAVQQKIKDAAK